MQLMLICSQINANTTFLNVHRVSAIHVDFCKSCKASKLTRMLISSIILQATLCVYLEGRHKRFMYISISLFSFTVKEEEFCKL